LGVEVEVDRVVPEVGVVVVLLFLGIARLVVELFGLEVEVEVDLVVVVFICGGQRRPTHGRHLVDPRPDGDLGEEDTLVHLLGVSLDPPPSVPLCALIKLTRREDKTMKARRGVSLIFSVQ